MCGKSLFVTDILRKKIVSFSSACWWRYLSLQLIEWRKNLRDTFKRILKITDSIFVFLNLCEKSFKFSHQNLNSTIFTCASKAHFTTQQQMLCIHQIWNSSPAVIVSLNYAYANLIGKEKIDKLHMCNKVWKMKMVHSLNLHAIYEQSFQTWQNRIWLLMK